MRDESVTRQKKSGFNKLALAAADSQLPYHQEDGDLILMCLRHLAYALEVREFPDVTDGAGNERYSKSTTCGINLPTEVHFTSSIRHRLRQNSKPESLGPAAKVNALPSEPTDVRIHVPRWRVPRVPGAFATISRLHRSPRPL